MHLSPIETILSLLVAVAALAWLAGRVKVPYPIFLTLAGVAVSLTPGLPAVPVAPDVVFLLFLPPLLYHAGMLTSWRDFRANIRPISTLALGLVLFTTVAVAVVAHYLTGMPWAAAFVLGAIISPPDAVAATAITQRLRVPKRVGVILEGESLVNDASALICYKFAVAVVAGQAFSPGAAGLNFLVSGLGGVVVGYAVGWFMVWLRPRLRDSSVEGVAALLIPYIAYLPAERMHVSGVLAAVTAGLYVGRRVPRITTSGARLRLYAVWDTVVFLLNGLVFILIGLQMPTVVGNLGNSYGWTTLTLYAAVVSATAILVRVGWVFAASYAIRLIPAVRRTDPLPDLRSVFLVSWIGLRGIVSLAAALALPLTVGPGDTPFPARDLILFLTFGVILVTLVGQGLTLPAVIRGLRLTPDDIEEKEEELARLEMTNAALSRLQVLALTDEADEDILARVRSPYEQRLQYFGPRRRGIFLDDSDAVCRTTEQVTRAALEAEREMLLRLRDEGHIGDDVLRKVQAELDLQEARLGSEDEVRSGH
jgi:Na+/H+ antiporter